jgi:hypothetical protein
MLLPLLHACYTRTTCSALLPCTDCTLAQPLPLPTANSPTCLTLYYYLYDCGSTVSLLAADAVLLPLHAHYLICATTDYDYSLDKRLPLPSQRNS